MYSRKALIGAIGETHISLAVGDIDELTVAHFALLSSADFDTPMEAIARYLPSLPERPERVALALCGKVDAEGADIPARGWRFTARDIGAAAGAREVLLVPELEALAAAMPHLAAADLVPVQQGRSEPDAPALVMLSGNDFAAALLHRLADGAPVLALAPGLLDKPGGGLMGDTLTARGLLAAFGEGPGRKAADIVKLGLSAEDPRAAALVDETVTALGHAAAELALLTGARAGLFLTGAIASTIVPARPDLFRTAFLRKAAAAPWLDAMPIEVIKVSADAAMRGAAVRLAARDS